MIITAIFRFSLLSLCITNMYSVETFLHTHSWTLISSSNLNEKRDYIPPPLAVLLHCSGVLHYNSSQYQSPGNVLILLTSLLPVAPFLYHHTSLSVSLAACHLLQSRPNRAGDPRYLSVSAQGSLIAEGTAGGSGSRHRERLEWLERCAAMCQTAPGIQTPSRRES